MRDLLLDAARLKFLKAPRTELDHADDVVERLAMAHPWFAFTLAEDERTRLRLPAVSGEAETARLDRLGAVLGRDFAANALAIAAERERHRRTGFAGLPTLNRGTSGAQYLVVNGRPARSSRARRGARRVSGFPRPRAPPRAGALLELPPRSGIDVDLHPRKAEVRFREAGWSAG